MKYKTYRAMVVVTCLRGRSVEVLVPQWNSKRKILIPRSVFGRFKPKKERMFIASVNIDADRAEDLVFENLEVAPPPDGKS